MIRKMRSSATHRLVAVALAGLLTSAPAQAVGPEDARRIDELVKVVSELKESLEPVYAAEPTVEAEVQPAYERIGEGEASYYGHELAGNRTASGERFNPQAMTAAHRTLPLGTKLRVTNKANGRSVVVRINDRGPFVGNRLIDLSLGAARELQMVRSGKAQVTLERLRIS